MAVCVAVAVAVAFRFYPSSLAASLTMAPKHVASTPEAVNRSAVPLAAPATDGASSAGMSSMQIIVEKNFKVRAHCRAQQ